MHGHGTATATFKASPTALPWPTVTPLWTSSASATATPTPSSVATVSPTHRASPTIPETATGTPGRGATPSSTETPSPTVISTASSSRTPAGTADPSATASPSATPTDTHSPTAYATVTASRTTTASAVPTPTRSDTATPTKTPTPGVTPTHTPVKTDYSIWSLQEPNGATQSNATLAAGYSDAYFYLASDGGQSLMDTATGATTSGSVHCRCELRETTVSGAVAAWVWTGTNTMTVSVAVTLQGGGTAGTTTIGQVFDGTDSIPLCELEYTQTKNSAGGNFQMLYEEAKGAGSNVYFGNTAPLGSAFTYELALSGGVLTVSINGTQVYVHTPSYSGKTFYFKTGDYDQTATSGAVNTTPYTIVEDYSIAVVHL